ncbi:MAG TPA: tRNA (adenosine(37)-N6)-threonylcarbamoyltransferase complex ATPase subunit type 1 TsaE [Thermoanaerobaculia bacterium]|nr:tRNA (adenosine(37)-N6)-threonylcarbamoyltransferase complex ATPase subunit type 1 TsaE [Thermoanaerobaculia bacterium]
MTVVSSASEEDTRRAGAELARRLRPGDAVLLEGDLGAGKTVFVKGLAEGLGLDPDDVSSPSFALVHEYGPPGRPPVLLHADLYRVAEGGGPVEDLGLDERGAAVLAVEWPRPPLASLRAWRVSIAFAEGGARRIDVAAPEGGP